MASFYLSQANGNDANDGLSINTAKATFVAAYDVAANGDTVFILDGIFLEANFSGYLLLSKQLKFVGLNENRPLVGGTTGTFSVRLSAPNISFSGINLANTCLLYTSPSPRDATLSRMPSSA